MSKIPSKNYNFEWSKKNKVIFASLIFVALFLTVDHVVYVNAITPQSRTIALTGGVDNQIAIRDVSDTSRGDISVSHSTPIIGLPMGIVVTDPAANVNPTALDVVLSSATSTTSDQDVSNPTLTETGASTGVFSGSIILSSKTDTSNNALRINKGDAINVTYTGNVPEEASRMSATLTGVTAGNVVITDDILTATEIANACTFEFATHPLEISFTNGGGATGITITLSYANGEGTKLDDPINFGLKNIVIGYRPSSGAAITLISTTTDGNGDNIADTVDTVAKTVTSESQPPSVAGQYLLGYNLGSCSGGGGGGVSAQTTVNALAGIGVVSKILGAGSSSSGSGFTSTSSQDEGIGGIIQQSEPAPLESEIISETSLDKIEEPTTENKVNIPIWVKNNADWWRDNEIDDSNFVSGIEYMVNEGIIIIPETKVSTASTEVIPSWIKDVAGFWADDMISNEEFIQSLQWLISNGVMSAP